MSKDVIFGISPVAGGVSGKPWGKLGFYRGERVRGDHGIVTHSFRTNGEDIPEPDSLDSLRGGQSRQTRLISVCVVNAPVWKGGSSWPLGQTGAVMFWGQLSVGQFGFLWCISKQGGPGSSPGEVRTTPREAGEGEEGRCTSPHLLWWAPWGLGVTFGLDRGLAQLQARRGDGEVSPTVFGLFSRLGVMPDLNFIQLRAAPSFGRSLSPRARFVEGLDPADSWLQDKGYFGAQVRPKGRPTGCRRTHGASLHGKGPLRGAGYQCRRAVAGWGKRSAPAWLRLAGPRGGGRPGTGRSSQGTGAGGPGRPCTVRGGGSAPGWLVQEGSRGKRRYGPGQTARGVGQGVPGWVVTARENGVTSSGRGWAGRLDAGRPGVGQSVRAKTRNGGYRLIRVVTPGVITVVRGVKVGDELINSDPLRRRDVLVVQWIRGLVGQGPSLRGGGLNKSDYVNSVLRVKCFGLRHERLGDSLAGSARKATFNRFGAAWCNRLGRWMVRGAFDTWYKGECKLAREIIKLGGAKGWRGKKGHSGLVLFIRENGGLVFGGDSAHKEKAAEFSGGSGIPVVGSRAGEGASPSKYVCYYPWFNLSTTVQEVVTGGRRGAQIRSVRDSSIAEVRVLSGTREGLRYVDWQKPGALMGGMIDVTLRGVSEPSGVRVRKGRKFLGPRIGRGFDYLTTSSWDKTLGEALSKLRKGESCKGKKGRVKPSFTISFYVNNGVFTHCALYSSGYGRRAVAAGGSLPQQKEVSLARTGPDALMWCYKGLCLGKLHVGPSGLGGSFWLQGGGEIGSGRRLLFVTLGKEVWNPTAYVNKKYRRGVDQLRRGRRSSKQVRVYVNVCSRKKGVSLDGARSNHLGSKERSINGSVRGAWPRIMIKNKGGKQKGIHWMYDWPDGTEAGKDIKYKRRQGVKGLRKSWFFKEGGSVMTRNGIGQNLLVTLRLSCRNQKERRRKTTSEHVGGRRACLRKSLFYKHSYSSWGRPMKMRGDFMWPRNTFPNKLKRGDRKAPEGFLLKIAEGSGTRAALVACRRPVGEKGGGGVLVLVLRKMGPEAQLRALPADNCFFKYYCGRGVFTGKNEYLVVAGTWADPNSKKGGWKAPELARGGVTEDLLVLMIFLAQEWPEVDGGGGSILRHV